MEHKIIPSEELVLPATVYKYRRWNKDDHRRIITHNEVFFSPPSQLGDPDDCRIPFRFDLVTDEQWIEFQKRVKKYNEPDLTEKEILNWIAQNINTDSDIRTNPRLRKEWIEKGYKERDQFLGVLSMALSSQNYKLWEDRKFGFYHSGFCVGFDLKAMISDRENFGAGGHVNYYPVGNPPVILPFRESDTTEATLKRYRKEIYYLKDEFAYQEEYRLTKSYSEIYDSMKAGESVCYQRQLELRRVSVPIEAYKEIIIGAKMTQKQQNEILKTVSERMPLVKCFQAIRDKAKQKITLEPICLPANHPLK